MDGLGESPEGYSDYTEYTVPEKKLVAVVLFLTFALGEVFFPGVTLWFYQQVNQDLGALIEISAQELLFLAGMVAVHEAIHYLVGWKQGHSPEFGIRLIDSFWILKEPTPYVATFDEHISRQENISSLIAPLLVIDAIALIALLPVFPASVIYYAKIALAINTAASMQDVYNVVRLLKMEEGTQFINVAGEKIRSFYCIPVSGKSTGE